MLLSNLAGVLCLASIGFSATLEAGDTADLLGYDRGACEAPKVIQSDKSYSKSFLAQYALTDTCEGACASPKKYFLLPDRVRNQGFTIDTGCLQSIGYVLLKNTHNGECNDRGTKHFAIELSEDNKVWQTVYQGTLMIARNKKCNTPLEKFFVGDQFARYLRFKAISFYGQGAGLSFISWKPLEKEMCDTPKILSSDKSYSKSFLAKNVFKNTCEGACGSPDKYFLLPDKVKNQGFVVDTGCVQSIAIINLKNTHNGKCNDRGTKGYTLEISENNKDWKKVYSGEMATAKNKGCKAPIERINIGDEYARFIRFTATSYYGHGAGLNYIGWSEWEENVCGTRQIIQTAKPYSGNFVASNVLTKFMCEGKCGNPDNYFLLPDKVTGQGFTVDTGCIQNVDFIKLRNTHNGKCNDRGTKDFLLEVSDDLKEWRKAFKGALTSAKGRECRSPVQNVYVGEDLRYIRFRANSFYGQGAGLNWLGWASDSKNVTDTNQNPLNIKSWGCYSTSKPVLQDAIKKRILNNNPTICAIYCSSKGFSFSGVKNARFCYCGKKLNSGLEEVDAEDCSIKCPGKASSDQCGGVKAMDVWQDITKKA